MFVLIQNIFMILRRNVRGELFEFFNFLTNLKIIKTFLTDNFYVYVSVFLNIRNNVL